MSCLGLLQKWPTLWFPCSWVYLQIVLFVWWSTLHLFLHLFLSDDGLMAKFCLRMLSRLSETQLSSWAWNILQDSRSTFLFLVVPLLYRGCVCSVLPEAYQWLDLLSSPLQHHSRAARLHALPAPVLPSHYKVCLGERDSTNIVIITRNPEIWVFSRREAHGGWDSRFDFWSQDSDCVVNQFSGIHLEFTILNFCFVFDIMALFSSSDECNGYISLRTLLDVNAFC